MMLYVNRNSRRSSSTRVEESVPALVYPYRAGLIGGALGGAALITVAVVYSLMSGRGIWLPINLIGATLIPDLQSASLAALAQFNAVALIAGVLLHTALSIGLGFVFAVLLPTLPGSPVIWSLTIGALLWSLAGLIGLPLLNPIMGRTVDGSIFFMGHLAYGLALGGWIARTPKILAE
jgi:hypothetical protein